MGVSHVLMMLTSRRGVPLEGQADPFKSRDSWYDYSVCTEPISAVADRVDMALGRS